MTIVTLQEMIKIVRPELDKTEEDPGSSVYLTLSNGKEIKGILRIAVSEKTGVVTIAHKVGENSHLTAVSYENIVSISHQII